METKYTAQDYKKGQPRWCPGCGDHFFLASLHKAMAEIGVAPHNIAVISGIGCSSRLPHYMNTYGMNTIHGRAAAIATGCKVANPELSVWQVSGDGDGLAIGGNHFIHANRRNINLNMILLNNRIYGLTKGQYSPTSPRGFVSKSSPFGTVEDPFRPAELCFGARGRFFARAVATDAAGTVEVLNSIFTATGIHRITIRKERLTTQRLYGFNHRASVVRTQVRDITQLTEVHLDGNELTIHINIRKTSFKNQLAKLCRKTVSVSLRTEVGKKYF